MPDYAARTHLGRSGRVDREYRSMAGGNATDSTWGMAGSAGMSVMVIMPSAPNWQNPQSPSNLNADDCLPESLSCT